MIELTRASFARMVDHTLLAATATERQVRTLCAEARDLGTAAVCVNGRWVEVVADELADTDIATCSVVGFPLGAMAPAAVVAETGRAIDDGAREIDMVISVGHVKAGDDAGAGATISAVRDACPGATLKVILETAVLDDDEIVRACRVSVDAGADFVKTSTGFHTAGGATVAAVELMSSTVGPSVGVKASGGLRTLADVRAMVEAGATRLGMSATAAVAAQLV